MPWAWPRLRGQRTDDGAGRRVDHPATGGRRMADRVAGAKPAGHSGHPGLQRRPALAGPFQTGPRLDLVHRRAAHRARLRRLYASRDAGCPAPQGRAELPGHLHRRTQTCAAHLRHLPKCLDEKAGLSLHGRQRLPGVRGQTAEARIARRQVRGPGHRRAVSDAARPDGADAGTGRARPIQRRC